MRDVLVAGDTLDFITDVTNFPASDGWVLNYRLAPFTAGTAIEFSATTYEVDRYRVQVPNTTTANYAAGKYSWHAYVTKGGGERYTVDSGTLTIKPNPAVGTSYDARTHAQKMLDAIEAALEGKATDQQLDLLSFTVGSRVQQRDVGKLLPMRDKYKLEVARQQPDAHKRRRIGIRLERR